MRLLLMVLIPFFLSACGNEPTDAQATVEGNRKLQEMQDIQNYLIKEYEIDLRQSPKPEKDLSENLTREQIEDLHYNIKNYVQLAEAVLKLSEKHHLDNVEVVQEKRSFGKTWLDQVEIKLS